jgi:hypothetical protein
MRATDGEIDVISASDDDTTSSATTGTMVDASSGFLRIGCTNAGNHSARMRFAAHFAAPLTDEELEFVFGALHGPFVVRESV